MRLSRAAGALTVIVAFIGLAGCATPAPQTASPPGDGTRLGLSTPFPATVLDDGSGPELCLGVVLQPYPPRCSGPALVSGWDWADWDGAYESASGVRWGEFWVAGFYDPAADAFGVEEARPADAVDWPAAEETGPVDLSPGDRTEAELQAILDEIMSDRDDVLVAGTDTMSGTVTVSVVFDDGSVQDELDAHYGEGVIAVDSALVPWP